MIRVPTERLPAGVTFIAPTVPVYVQDAAAPGPTVLIQAGIHGDEVCGVHALEELLEEGLAPTAGRLILVPRMNPAAYRVRDRTAVGGLDLNRSFPGDPEAPELEHRLAHAFFRLVHVERPALVATLHESKKRYHPDVHPSFGQTLVYGVTPCPPVLSSVVEALNGAVRDPEERWATHYFPVPTSSTEQIVDAIGCVGVCVETWMGFGEPRRVEMQREVVLRLLDAFGVVPLA
ncbi:MAG: putative deacylase [Myxococcota bacterium]